MKQLMIKFSIAFASFIFFVVCVLTTTIKVAVAKSEMENQVAQEVSAEEENTERLLTNLEIVLNGGDREVCASVKNKFTLFPSTVYVIVQLFRSDSYCEDYNDMTLVAVNSTTDLDMGHIIEAKASTEGKQSYWMGRMRYRIGNKDWDERTVGAMYSAEGEFLGLA